MTKIVVPNSKLAGRDDSPVKTVVSEDQIAVLAYHLWQSRGCPEGSAEADWYEAAEGLRRAVRASDSGARAAGA